jgi:hypothetical protein
MDVFQGKVCANESIVLGEDTGEGVQLSLTYRKPNLCKFIGVKNSLSVCRILSLGVPSKKYLHMNK